jgi:hypothetical protein
MAPPNNLSSSTKLGVFGVFPMFSIHQPGVFDKSSRIGKRSAAPLAHSLANFAPWRLGAQYSVRLAPTDQNTIKIGPILPPFCSTPNAISSMNQAFPRITKHQNDRILMPHRDFSQKLQIATRDSPTAYELGHTAPKFKIQNPRACREPCRAAPHTLFDTDRLIHPIKSIKMKSPPFP